MAIKDIITYDEFLKLIPGTQKKAGKGVLVLCPAHNDHNPSLWITPSDNPDFTLDFSCQANCEKEAILKALNLTWDNIRINHNGHKPDTKPHREIETIYKYVKDGKLIFEVVRTNPKGFFQRHPDGKGDYINNLQGVETCLYQHDEIINAIERGDLIFLPEGEKDADSLWERGLPATTNPGGAGKWLESWTGTLKGARIVNLQDNDKTGKEFALQKLNSLYGKVNSLKLVELPAVNNTIKDITDWFNAGHETAELLDLVAKTPEWNPQIEYTKRLVCLADVQPIDVDWLWKPLIPLGKLTLLEGDPGTGKSTVAEAIGTG
jgi:hypothetical protein